MIFEQSLPILMYHHVSPNPGLVTVSPGTFENHIKTLAESGWKTAGLQAVETLLSGKPLPKKTLIITFDDGYLDNYVYAYPILKEYGMKGVIFVATGWIGDGKIRKGILETPSHRNCKLRIETGLADEVMLRWSEIELMKQEGVFEFHSHTHTHTRWDLQLSDPEKIRSCLHQDLIQSRESLMKHLGSCSKHLCWPQGYFDAAYKHVATTCGFDFFYTTIKHVNSPSTDPQEISRFVTKEKSGQWLKSRCWLYSRPLIGKLYSLIRTH